MKNQYDFNLKNSNKSLFLMFLLFLVLISSVFSCGDTLAKFSDVFKGSDNAFVAKPIFVVENVSTDIFIDETGNYRFCVSNTNGLEISETPLVYYIKITLPKSSSAVPSKLLVSLDNAYSDEKVLLNSGETVSENIYIYKHESMNFDEFEKKTYYDLQFEGIHAGISLITVDIFAEQRDN